MFLKFFLESVKSVLRIIDVTTTDTTFHTSPVYARTRTYVAERLATSVAFQNDRLKTKRRAERPGSARIRLSNRSPCTAQTLCLRDMYNVVYYNVRRFPYRNVCTSYANVPSFANVFGTVRLIRANDAFCSETVSVFVPTAAERLATTPRSSAAGPCARRDTTGFLSVVNIRQTFVRWPQVRGQRLNGLGKRNVIHARFQLCVSAAFDASNNHI